MANGNSSVRGLRSRMESNENETGSVFFRVRKCFFDNRVCGPSYVVSTNLSSKVNPIA